MVPQISYCDKFAEDRQKGSLVFTLQSGIKVFDCGTAVYFEGISLDRRYYLIHLSAINDSKAICTLKTGDKVKGTTPNWYKIDRITKSEYGTYKEFGLFPVLEHEDEFS